ncbi:hypothetical protein QJ527_07185 [Enterococcus mundtii]|uniref:hypothetical protein n=1 Tax=Enterococcus mundtii TaxID=53346 RepID=UPI0025434D9D|nr:hypothetical protein [Enterococcus mundtii]MDK4211325.1 hypothetical protein [Enterococcus mundtii]
MKDLKQLISEKEKELQSLENSLGLGFPIIEQAKSTRICYLQAELENLKTLDEQPELNDDQKVVLEWLKEEKTNSNLTAFDCIYSFIYGNPKGLITQIWSELNEKEEAQILEVFSQWVQEQEKIK